MRPGSRATSSSAAGPSGAARACKSVLISLASTVVLAIVAWITLINTPGFWRRVQQTFFNPGGVHVEALPSVAVGFLLNLRVLAFAVVGVLIFSVLIAIIRTLRGPVFFPLRALAAGYTDLFRGMPPHHRAVPGRVRHPRPDGYDGAAHPVRDARHDRAHPDLLGLRVRGVPGWDRGRASVAAARALGHSGSTTGSRCGSSYSRRPCAR